MEVRFTEKDREWLKGYGLLSRSSLASLLAELYFYSDHFGEWAIDALIEAIHHEISQLHKEDDC